MGDELLKKRLKENLGKEAVIFLKNDFRFQGTITGCDDKYLEIVEPRPRGYKLILIEEIKQLEIKDG